MQTNNIFGFSLIGSAGPSRLDSQPLQVAGGVRLRREAGEKRSFKLTRGGREGVMPPLPPSLDADQADALKRAKMARDRGLRQAQDRGQVADAESATAQQAQGAAARGIGEGSVQEV